jgi:hypothetical protein
MIPRLSFSIALLALAVAGCTNTAPGDQAAMQPATIQPVTIQPLAIQPPAIQPLAIQSETMRPVIMQPATMQTATAITFPDGAAGYSVDCTQAQDYCQGLAGNACPSGYSIVTAEFRTTSGLHPRSMDVRCLSNWF